MGAEHVLTEEDLGNMDKKALKVHMTVIWSVLKIWTYLRLLAVWVRSQPHLIIYFLLCTGHNLYWFCDILTCTSVLQGSFSAVLEFPIFISQLKLFWEIFQSIISSGARLGFNCVGGSAATAVLKLLGWAHQKLELTCRAWSDRNIECVRDCWLTCPRHC